MIGTEGQAISKVPIKASIPVLTTGLGISAPTEVGKSLLLVFPTIVTAWLL